jgi:hypothetical protein
MQTRATIPRTGGRLSLQLVRRWQQTLWLGTCWLLPQHSVFDSDAGDHPQNWRATNPTTGVTRLTTLRPTPPPDKHKYVFFCVPSHVKVIGDDFLFEARMLNCKSSACSAQGGVAGPEEDASLCAERQRFLGRGGYPYNMYTCLLAYLLAGASTCVLVSVPCLHLVSCSPLPCDGWEFAPLQVASEGCAQVANEWLRARD